MRTPLALGCVALLVAAGCSPTPAANGALQVQVVMTAGTQSRCVKVVVEDGTRSRESAPIVVAGRSLLRVAVYQDDFDEPVRLGAVGYADDACETLTVPGERSTIQPGRFTSPPSTVTLSVWIDPSPDGGAFDGGGTDAGAPDAGAPDAGAPDAGAPDAGAPDAGAPDAGADGGAADAAVDFDNDGYSPPDDCDDMNGAIHPDAGELCAGGVDEDCDGLIDCAESQCLAQPCGMNGTCTAGGTCQAPVETGLCNDGVDNDQDSLVDCEDPDCPAGAACSDSNACTLVDICGGADAGCVSGSDLVCVTPPAQCFSGTGACLPDAGTCSYAVRTGSCDDTLGCTETDTCLADGGCEGSPKSCVTPPGACFSATGACEEPAGTCAYAPLPSGACSDGDNCTVSDSCDGDGGCVGTPVTCTAPAECLAATGTCDPDGGCLFAPRTGQACDGGTGVGSCSDAGACVIGPVIFPYVPSNFQEAQLPANGGAMTFSCGTTVLDTQSADGGIAWNNLCGAITPPEFALVTVGAQTAVLLFAESLSVPGGNTLRAVGARPLILAVRTTATIGGVLEAASDRNQRRGAGANDDCGAAGVGGLGGNGGTNSNRGGGGGGGAFGADGADGAQGNGGGAAGVRGKAFGVAALVPLRGGCAGGNGGGASGNDGVGGFGGGALQLSVAGALSLTGTGRVTASGGGGRGGAVGSSDGDGPGGGGGGSGGGVLLEGDTVSMAVTSAITANAGGGGEGNGVTTDGDDGSNGSSTTGLQAAGGTNGGCGGNGGLGGALLGATAGSQEGCTTSNSGSGGGGGGGVGRIRVNALSSCLLVGTVSPLPSGNSATGCPAP